MGALEVGATAPYRASEPGAQRNPERCLTTSPAPTNGQ